MRGHVWTCVDICEHLWTLHSAGRSDLADIGGHLWTSVDMRGHVWTCVDMCGHVWTLDPGPRCAYCAAVRPSRQLDGQVTVVRERAHDNTGESRGAVLQHGLQGQVEAQ